MSFGDRLKEKREELGITQPQLAEMLGVSKGAIGNYETGLNSPRAAMLYKIFDVLHCDANFLFQDEMKEIEENESPPLTKHENQMIKKYRTLDDYGTDLVDAVIDKEYVRCLEQAEELMLVARSRHESSDELKKKAQSIVDKKGT